MDVNVRNISEYIEKMVGAEVQIEPLDKAKKQALPVLITNAYQLLQCQLLGAEVSLMVCKDANATPMQLKKHCAIVGCTIRKVCDVRQNRLQDNHEHRAQCARRNCTFY